MFKPLSLLLTIAALFAATPSQAVILRDIGEGSDFSNLYIQFSDPDYEAVHFRYFYDYSETTPVTGAQMIFNIVNASGSGLSILDNGGGVTFEMFLFVFEFKYNGDSQYGDFSSSETWNYYVAGGEHVAYNSETFTPIWGPGGEGDYTFNSIPDGEWLSAPVGSSDRVIVPGSWDGWSFGVWPGPELDIAPIPEPSTIALASAGVLILLARRFRRRTV